MHLGDGAYVSFSPGNGAVVITAGSHIEFEASNKVYLDTREAVQKLADYLQRVLDGAQ